MKRLALMTAAAATAIAALLGPARGQAAPSPRQALRLAASGAIDTPVGEALARISLSLVELSRGQLAVSSVRPSGPVLDMLGGGQVDIAAVPTGELNAISRDAFAVYDLPFLFESPFEVAAVQNSVAGIRSIASLEQQGFIGLGYLNNGVSTLVTRRSPSEVADLKGQKIRVPNPRDAAAVSMLGAVPVTTAFGELAAALELGAFDGVETSASLASQLFQAGVAGSFAATPLRPSVSAVLIRKDLWRSLSYRDQALIADAVASASAGATEAAARRDGDARKVLAATGRVHAIDAASLAPSARDVWRRAKGIEGSGILETVLPIVQETREKGLPLLERRGGERQEQRLRIASVELEGRLKPGEVLFATDRQADPDPEPRFRLSGRRGPLSFGRASFSIAPTRPMGSLDAQLLPMDDLVGWSLERLVGRLQAALRASGTRDVVVFVHGYNNGFDDAARSLAAISADVKFGAVPLLYSWPSDGAALSYGYDEEQVRASRDNFLAFLEVLAKVEGVERVHIAAHSMGNRLVTEAIDRFDAAAPDSRKLFHHVVMAAPDVYVGLFEQAADAFRRRAHRITLYASDNDTALKCSFWVHGNRRLGQAGSALFFSQGFETIDASSVEPPPSFFSFERWPGLRALASPCGRGHAYMIRSLRVQSDLQSLIQNDLPAAARHGLSEKRLGQAVYWAFRPSD